MGEVLQGDCLEVLKTLPDSYFDSLLIDPPAGIAFMGKDWDKDKKGMLNWINWLSEILAEVNRTLKPGALGLVWSIPRTSHWTGMAIELAGFKIIDICHHAQGSGFPKAQDLGSLIDKLYGAEREVWTEKRNGGGTKKGESFGGGFTKENGVRKCSAPATPEAKYWDGWKTTALKPAIEGWWLIQKKISETSIARNVLKHGVGGLNIDACRIPTDNKLGGGGTKGAVARHDGYRRPWMDDEEMLRIHAEKCVANVQKAEQLGRYPANLVLSCSADCDPSAGCGENGAGAHAPDCPVSVIGAQSGESVSQKGHRDPNGSMGFHGGAKGTEYRLDGYSDKGTAARFFKQFPFDPETATSIYYQAKASKADRTCGGVVSNVHPTVKSRHLIAYFLKLITPPGGRVLDCFGGSGTTAVAAIENGFNYCLIEKEPEYIEIINQRIAATQLPEIQLSLV